MIDIKPVSARHCIDELTKRGYDSAAIYRYACAARSWCEKDSAERKVWKEVEAKTSLSGSAG